VEVLAARPVGAGEALVDVALYRRLPAARIGGVDREFLRVRGDADLRMGEDEGIGLAIERESVHAFAYGKDEHRGWAIHGKAGGYLAAAGLQERRLLRLAVLAVRHLRAAQHREDGADRDVHIDVR